MSNELRGVTSTGEVCYAIVINASGQFFNGTTFEAFTPANYLNYDITMAESGSTGIYFGDFPVAITSNGTYEYFVKRQQGGAPAEDDPIASTGKIDWTGSAAVSVGAGAMSGSNWRDYVLRGGFKRTDKDTELYEETTDAVQEMRRKFMFDEAEAETVTVDLISVLGDFKLNLESDFGLLLGVIVEDGQSGTQLIYKSKHEFNNLYPDINVTTDRGYPKHFTVFGSTIQVGPIPDKVTYSYRIAYSSRGGVITSTSTGVPFTQDYRDILRDNVLGRLYKLMDDFKKANTFRQYFLSGFEDAKARDRMNSGAGSFNVKPFGL